MKALRILCLLLLASASAAPAALAEIKHVYDPGMLPPTDSTLKVAEGEAAPDFTLPTIEGRTVTLSDYRGDKNVVISFVPAAFTPVCSEQWPGYNLAEELIKGHDAVVIGISTDNTPSQWAWTREMGGVWFEVASDFWPHGETAAKYGLLRSSGTSERATIIIDKAGVIRDIEVHDINARPDLERLLSELAKLDGE